MNAAHVQKMPPVWIIKLTGKIRQFLIRLSKKMAPQHIIMFEMAHAFWLSKAMGTAAELNIADVVQSGKTDINEIAKATNTNTDALYRLMRALASEGIFKEKNTKTFVMTPRAKALLNDSPVKYMIQHHAGKENWKIFSELTQCIRTGKNSAEKVLGMSVFEFLEKNKDKSIVFNKSMKNGSQLAVTPTLMSYQFGTYKKIIDLGGGSGYLLSAILEKNKNATGIVFDLPHVVKDAHETFKSLNVSNRVQVVSGSFFDDIPSGGDLYILKSVLHDWDDEDSIKILKNIRKVAKPNTKLIIVESLVESDNKPLFGKFVDLQMLCIVNGKERNLEEYKALLNNSGFKLNRTFNTFAAFSIIEVVITNN